MRMMRRPVELLLVHERLQAGEREISDKILQENQEQEPRPVRGVFLCVWFPRIWSGDLVGTRPSLGIPFANESIKQTDKLYLF